MDIHQFIKETGLEYNEASVYLALLELGESGIIPITHKVKLPRTTVFHILDRLRDLGLVEIVFNKSRRIYFAHNPHKITVLLQQNRQELDKRIDSINTMMPDLMNLYLSSPFQPHIRYFRGEEIKQIYEEILLVKDKEIYYTGNINQLEDILSKRFFQDWISRKVKAGIWTRSIRSHTTEDDAELYRPTKNYLRKARYASDRYSSPSHVYIYDNNVAILTSSRENFGVVITSRDYATTMRNMYKELWKYL